MTSLPQGLLDAVVGERLCPETRGIVLKGSFARGTANRWSDADLNHFVRATAVDRFERYRLHYRDGFLVSVTTLAVEDQEDEMRRPDRAVWAVPGILDSLVLLDVDGSMQSLKRQAEEFRWEPLQNEANRYAGAELMGTAEEVHKILAALELGDEPALHYATLGLTMNMTAAMAVRLGVMIESENRYFDLVEEAVGLESEWTRLHRSALGLTDSSSPRSRGVAALRLYEASYALLLPWIAEGDAEVAQEACVRISLTG